MGQRTQFKDYHMRLYSKMYLIKGLSIHDMARLSRSDYNESRIYINWGNFVVLQT